MPSMTKADSKLRQWRKRHGLSQEDVSGLSGLSVPTVSRVERGERRLAPLTKVRVARLLGAPVRDLFEVDPIEVTEAEQ